MNSKESFLRAVARACVDRHADLSETCFVFPSKRAGTFFLKALSSCLKRDETLMAPEVLTASDFMSRIAHLEEAPRIDLVFRLYEIYRCVQGGSIAVETADDLVAFDDFAPWADTILSDFSEVDRYAADAEKVFQNVVDYREIASNFLTEEQCDLIERYFGYRPSSATVESFWKSVGDPGSLADGAQEDGKKKIRERFVELWRQLPELYTLLVPALEREGLGLQGSIYRRAMERVLDHGRDALPWKRVAVVGFYDFSTSEARLYDALAKETAEDGDPMAEFFWDVTGPALESMMQGSTGTVAKTLARNIKNFPSPEWAAPYLESCRVASLPDVIEVASAPSNAAQVKIAAAKISEWIESLGAGELEKSRAAIVIPDDSLLLPLVHSLPDALPAVNLTLGFSMRYTSVASFMHHFRRMLLRQRQGKGGNGFNYEDFLNFLSHPLAQLVSGSADASKMKTDIARKHIRIVTHEWIRERSQELASLLDGAFGLEGVGDTIDYIEGVLRTLDCNLASADRDKAATVNSRIERSLILHYQLALRQLGWSIANAERTNESPIRISPRGVFHMIDRLMTGERVSLEGKPVEGLQILGLLETRAIDFDHLLVLSMNDAKVPRRSRPRTFIPESIRSGYGLPSTSHAEEADAYYFYRLMARPSDITLTYDGRPGEAGGRSRFIAQLEMLNARGNVHETVHSFRLDTELGYTPSIAKTPGVMERLEKYLDGTKNLSASALNNYNQCPVKFYYKYVFGLHDEIEAANYLDPITLGNIIHNTMLNLYLPDKSERKKYLRPHKVFTASQIEAMLADRKAIEREVCRQVNKQHFHLRDEDLDRKIDGTIGMMVPQLVEWVCNLLERDLRRAPLEIVGAELEGLADWQVNDELRVRFRYAFDRVEVSDGEMRIVDFKSGSKVEEKAKAEDVADIFSGKSEYFFQLMLYANLMERRAEGVDRELANDIGMMLLDAKNDGAEVVPKLKVGPKTYRPVKGHAANREEFLTLLNARIAEIFDPEVPFSPATDPKACEYCNFKSFLCNR